MKKQNQIYEKVFRADTVAAGAGKNSQTWK